MFGNKKTTSDASNDDDIQLTTRSMKNDLQGNEAEESLIETETKSDKELELKRDEKPQDLPIKKEVPLKNKETASKEKISLPTDLPKKPRSLEDQLKENEPKEEKTHADDFFPCEKNNFPQNPVKKESMETPKKEFPNKQNLNKSSSTETAVGKKDYDEFFKDKIEKPAPEENNSSSLILVIILVVILIVAIASGAYYYFFVLSKATTPIEQQPTMETEPTKSFPIEPTPIEPESTLPTTLENANEISLAQNENLKATLFSTDPTNTLATGFYTIKDIEDKNVNASELSQLLNISFPVAANLSLNNSWIYYDGTDPNSPKIGLVIQIDPQRSNTIKQATEENEMNLIANMTGLYSEPLDAFLAGKEVSFKSSIDNPGFRYFNLSEVDGTKSLDWGIINDEFLVFATSKDMASAISEKLQTANENSQNTNTNIMTTDDVVSPEETENTAPVE